jgi:hypothetical protein
MKGLLMEWLEEHAKMLAFIFTLCTTFIGWLIRLEVRINNSATKREVSEALEKIYVILRPMGENIAYLKGRYEHDNKQ